MIFQSKSLLATTAIVGCSITSSLFDGADAHGYLKTPRSRNWYAYEEAVWWDVKDTDPLQESDPYSANRGGTAAQCGIIIDRNYDLPKNAKDGGLLKPVIQECYEEGSVIDVEVTLTAYHGGHFEFHACPISWGEVPTEACFKAHPLEFVEDVLHGAPKDPNYPTRAYIHGLSQMSFGNFHYKYKLPAGLLGELVLIQWYYVTGNTCTDEGYADYAFNQAAGFVNYNPEQTATCQLPITGDGSEAPERFWNCAEVRVTEDCSITTTTTTTPPTVCTPISQEELGYSVTAVSQESCNKCALNNVESTYWPCDSNPPLCDCHQGSTGTTTSTTQATTTTTTAATDQPTSPPTSPIPTQPPTQVPTAEPTKVPTDGPTNNPTTSPPTDTPTTASPTKSPTAQPTNAPTIASPTQPPTAQPTNNPTVPLPTSVPTPPPTNQPIPGSSGWYVDDDKCVLGESVTETLYSSASACCSARLSWMSNEMCVSRSTGVPTRNFYADQVAGVCRQDCPSGDGLPCGGTPTDLSSKLYSSLESCCTTGISWEQACVDKSNGEEPQGTGEYYVNWTLRKCALDCPVGSAPGCGGVKNPWDATFATSAACCSTISWQPDCVYGATTPSTTTSTTTTSTTTTPATTTTTQAPPISTTTTTTQPPQTTTTSTTSTTALTTTTTTTTPGSSGWYVDGDKCTLGQSTGTLYTDASACCTNQLSWMSNEMCVSRSTGVPSRKFYADQVAGVCRQDCSTGDGLPCGGSPTDLSSTLYSSLESCCTTSISWEPACVDKSNGDEPQGTGEYYVNWTFGDCVRDCPVGSAPGCGGVKNSWDTTFATSVTCCSTISWKADCGEFE